MQVLELAVEVGVLKVEDISLDGTKIHADASKSKAVSHKRLEPIKEQLQREIAELLEWGQQTDERREVSKVDVAAEIARRQGKLDNLAQAQSV